MRPDWEQLRQWDVPELGGAAPMVRSAGLSRIVACLAIVTGVGLCSGCVSSYDGAVQQARERAAYPLDFAVTTMGELEDFARIGQPVVRGDLEKYAWGLLLSDADRAEPVLKHIAVTEFSQEGRSIKARVFVRMAATFSRGLASTSAAVHGCATLEAAPDGTVSITDEPCEEWLEVLMFEDSKEVSLAKIHS